MRNTQLHSWDLTPKEAIALQRELASKVTIAPAGHSVRLIAGSDCAFHKPSDSVFASAVLWNVRTKSVQAASTVVQPCKFPYIPGLLSFREAPAILAAIQELPAAPDLVMCDGHGLAHPRGFGLACHIGVWLEIPAIGVAKSRLCGIHRTPGEAKGSSTRLYLDDRVVGCVLRTRGGVKPVYVSVGHRARLRDAAHWCLRTATRYRIPEPTRQAHLAVSREKRARQGRQ